MKLKLYLVQSTHWLLEHWLMIFLVAFGIFNVFLAPVAMQLGWTPLGNLIYWIYFPLCHQMAQRSFFLFGKHTMYDVHSLPIEITGDISIDSWTLKQFVGSESVGWKVAWSDRMVYMYGGTWLAAALYGWVATHRRIKRLSLWAFALLLMPMFVDGITQTLSDAMTGGLFGGFRYRNIWLQNLTHDTFPIGFYSGDGFGSFNSWMRLISGLAFGIGIVWLTFPMIEQDMRHNARQLGRKLQGFAPRVGQDATSVQAEQTQH